MESINYNSPLKCVISGPVKNCAPYLNKVFENIEKIGSLFEEYKILIYYDKSTDNTLEILKQYQQKNNRLKFYVNLDKVLKYRTHRIAKARNFCLNTIQRDYKDFPYFIMMDFDDVNCKNVNKDVLKKYLNREDWDALSFNTSPSYYDIWGLSIKPFCFSYNHFLESVKYYGIIQRYIQNKLNVLRDGELLPCISAFNGFAIYRTSKCINCYYDGKIRLDLIPKNFILKHMNVTNSPIIFKDYGHVDGRYEDCEHRSFHTMMINKNNGKIRISKDVIFN